MKPKPKTIICIIYYNKFDNSFIKSIPIENCTLSDIENILLNFYPNEKHIHLEENGNEYLNGAYDITPEINQILFEKFGIEVDIENFSCQLEEEYE
ncbi:hypothetical protein [Campylobacter concisus]|jgi:hypothetical protein|uniref:hypothetical protein n=3 Tax=Campylobacter concisus TaxID=199 RepID=UPI000CD8F8B2|nr:hypothetical protein [Campylobacter concisus]